MDLIEVARQCPDLTVSIRLGDLIEANQNLVEEALMRLEKSVAESRTEIYLSRTKVMEMLEVASATLWRWEKCGFEMPSEQYGSPVYLTLDDVDVIARADFSDDKELEIQRDIFVFQCNVGCRIGDLLRLKKRDIINGAVEYIPTKTIKERAKTVVVPLNAIAMSIVEKYKDDPGDQLLPFISSQNYNENIKTILEKAEITYLVTKLDSVTRTESKVPINEMASGHMARSTFIGNIYKLVRDPNLVSALTGRAEGSRAFNRYRDIDIDMKKDLVKILEGKR